MKLTRRLLRTAQRIDDLAEVILFDLLLATRNGRRVLAAAVATAGLLLYMSSGWLLNPRSAVAPERTSGAPYFEETAWTACSAEISQVALTGRVEPSRLQAVEAELNTRSAILDHVATLANAPQFITFERAPNPTTCRQIADALIARGACRAARGDVVSAGTMWLAAARFGRAAGRGHGEWKNLSEALVTTAIEQRAYHAFQNELKAHPGSILGGAVMFDIHRRNSGELRLVNDIAKAEYRDLIVDLHHLARGEPTQRDLNALRSLMPVRQAEREKFVNDVGTALMTSLKTTFEARTKEGRLTAPKIPNLCGSCSPGSPGWVHGLRALLSRDAAVRHVALELTPACETSFNQLMDRDQTIMDCWKRAAHQVEAIR